MFIGRIYLDFISTSECLINLIPHISLLFLFWWHVFSGIGLGVHVASQGMSVMLYLVVFGSV